MFRERVIDTQLHQVTEYESTQEFFAAKQVPAGIVTIYEGPLPIDLLISPADSDTTIFFFHGAIERDFQLPVLSGLGISGGLKANRVFISDPSLILDEKLLLSWYAGNYFQPRLQMQLLHIFRKIVEDLGTSRTVFFGGSGGGFASLFFAHHIDDSLALVFNPQTNIKRYSPNAVQDFGKLAFDLALLPEDLVEQLPQHVTYDLCRLYDNPTTATVAYIQNANDQEHIRSHLTPFREAMNSATNFLLLQGDWKDGHTPPPKPLLSDLLNLTASSDDWGNDLIVKGFEKISGQRGAVM